MSPTAPLISTLAGIIDNPEEYFGKERKETLRKLEGVMDMKVVLNRVWIAVWVRPNAKDLGEGKKLHFADNTRAEDVYQGCAGLVIKMGPQAFVSDENVKFDVVPKPGDWVLFRRQNAGLRFKHNGVDCVMLENETPIKAILTRPDNIE